VTRLEGKTALITGAARGIGRAIALRFAQEGCSLSLTDLDLEGAEETVSLAKEHGVDAFAVKADVTKRAEVEMMVECLGSQIGVPDILVNNAGIFFNTVFHEMTDEQWHLMMNVNLTSVFLISQAIIKIWLGAKIGGTIVNMSSMVKAMAFKNSSHYITSKTAVSGLTRALALDYASQGIRVNAIAPGMVETEMTRPALSDPELLSQWTPHMPLGRVGQPKDIADAALFLASEESSYITGNTIFVDGGWLLE
jgi:NAD(P)-dependent dehydrogenase (short-subunit alcohol dehydrogenase family)